MASLTAAADTRFGDYQSNAAMVLAKRLKTNPRELAATLIEGGSRSVPQTCRGSGDRKLDSGIGPAAADVAGHRRRDIIGARTTVALKQGGSGHDLA